MNDLKVLYNKIRLFYSKNSIDSIINNNCIINNINNIDNVSLSVVFTTHDRVIQTYFTLKSWNYIATKNNINIQIIIVEDTNDINSRLDLDKLIYSNLTITHILIINKKWINPCMNYNIGFKFIISDRVVITNAEICVFGNIYETINNNLTENKYLVFDVVEMGKKHVDTNNNKEIYKICCDFNYKTVINYIKEKDIVWLQSQYSNNRNLHFLTCIHNNTLQKIGGFDNEFIFHMDYDDNNLIYRIKKLYKLKIINFYNNKSNVIGLHQWHSRNIVYYTNGTKYNKLLNQIKNNYINKHRQNLNLKDFTKFRHISKHLMK
jgi:hypothetical protein